MTPIRPDRSAGALALQAAPLAASHIAASHVTRQCTARPRQAPAVHEHMVLALYTGGRACMEQHGRWQLGAGDAVLVPAGQPHRLLEADNAEYWGVAFLAAGYAADGGTPLLQPFERVRDGAAAVVPIPADRHALLHALFRELAQLSGPAPRTDAVEAAARHSLLTLILTEIERAARARPAPLAEVPASASHSVVSESLRYIERHCLRPLTLTEVAAAVGRSPAYVTTALSRATGRSAVQWIVSLRMAEARRLLLHSDQQVEAIARRLGYADATHFVRLFRREHGTPPATWRAEQRALG